MVFTFKLKLQSILFSLTLYDHDFTWNQLYSHEMRSFKEDWTECYLFGHFAIVYPAYSGKVGGLRTVEAMIEASMVAIREGDHELSSFLSNLPIYD